MYMRQFYVLLYFSAFDLWFTFLRVGLAFPSNLQDIPSYSQSEWNYIEWLALSSLYCTFAWQIQYQFSFVETPRKFIIANLSIR